MEPEDTSASAKTRQVEVTIHALRNGMNSMVMNAAVLASRAADFPEALRPFVDGITHASKRCSDELAQLYALIESQDKPSES